MNTIKQEGDIVGLIEEKSREFNKFNQDKWMRYEEDITAFYFKRIYDWFDSKDRKPSNIAFTNGLARRIAEAMEYAEKQV